MNRKGFEMSFSWMFSLIVGAVIIFIAVYAAFSFIRTSKIQTDTTSAFEIGNLLNPLETSLESGKYAIISFPEETKLYSSCYERGSFGSQSISVSKKGLIGKVETKPGISANFHNKYIFADEIEEGKDFQIFVIPLDYPFKVADLIVLSSKKYCLVNPKEDVVEELIAAIEVNANGFVNISNSASSCPVGSIKVCFDSTGCDIDVNSYQKTVNKEGELVHYQDNLVYGAIFSNKENYECQVKRLIKRAGELASLYAKKSELLSAGGCASNLEAELRQLTILAGELESSEGLNLIDMSVGEIRRKNDALICRLF